MGRFMMRLFCLLSVCYLWFCGFGGKQEGKVSDSALYVLKDKAYGHISKGEYQETERVCQEILQNTVWGGQEWFYTYALIYQGQARIMLGKTQEGLQDLLGAKRLAETKIAGHRNRPAIDQIRIIILPAQQVTFLCIFQPGFFIS